MDERIVEKARRANKQIKEAEKYAKIYQDTFNKQADLAIQKLDEESLRKTQEIDSEYEEKLKKINEISEKIKSGYLEELLKDNILE
jgi:uncharacterized protein YllA (UPF0747 family)